MRLCILERNHTVAVRGISIKTVALTALFATACLCNTGWAGHGDEAAAVLKQALERYDALDFQSSKALLSEVDRDGLSGEDRKTFDQYFAWIDTAIEDQDTARQWLVYGQRVMARGDLEEARRAFEQASASEFLDLAGRQLAGANLAKINQTIPQAQGSDTVTLSGSPTVDANEQELARQAAAVAFSGNIEYLGEEVLVLDSPDEEDLSEDASAKPVFDEIILAEATVDSGKTVGPTEYVEPTFPAPLLLDTPVHAGSDQADSSKQRSETLLAAGIVAMENGYNEQAKSFFRQALMEDPRSDRAEQMLRQVQQQEAPDYLEYEQPDGISDISQLAQADTSLEQAVSEMLGDDDSDDPSGPGKPLFISDDALDDSGPAVDSGPLHESEDGTLTRAIRIARVRREQAEVEFEKAMDRAESALAYAKANAQTGSDFDEAVDHVRVAQDVLETRRSLFTDDEYRELLAVTRSRLDQIEEERVAWEDLRIEQIKQQQIQADKDRIADELAQKRKKIDTLTNNAAALLRETRYEEALESLEQILELDPNNSFAVQKVELLQDFVVLLEEREYHQAVNRETNRAHLDNLAAMIPWHQYIRYPDDWPDLSRRRLREGVEYDQARESEANRRVYQRLQDKQSFEFNDIALEDVIQYIGSAAGVNIHVKWAALNNAGVDKKTPVNIQLLDVTVEKALRVILEDVAGVNPLGFYVDEGVITISTQEDLDQNMETRVYDIRDMILRVPDFVGPRLDLNVAAQAGAQAGGLTSVFEEEEEDEEELSREEIIERLIEKIEEILPARSWDEGSISEYRGQLIVKQTRENHIKIYNLLDQLREARAIQIAIEARFIQVDTGFMERVGIDLDLFFNIGSTLASQERSPPPAIVPGIYGPPNTTFTDPASYMRSSTTYTDPWNGGAINRFPGDHTAQSSHWTPVGVRTGNKLNWVVNTTSAPSNSIASTGVPTALSIAGAFLDDIEVDFLVQATQGHDTSRILTAPRLTLFNGQRAYITVGTQTAYIQSWRPMVAQQAAALQPIIGFIPTGSVLDIEATVSADRRYVTLTVRPQVAQLLDITTVDFTVGGGIGIGTAASISLPEVEVKDLQTTVSVPDGGTLLLGGQRFARSTEREVGPPILSKVPVINRFFTTRGEVRDESTLLILLKPKIIIQREEEEAAFP